jgi:hypothetical protein
MMVTDALPPLDHSASSTTPLARQRIGDARFAPVVHADRLNNTAMRRLTRCRERQQVSRVPAERSAGVQPNRYYLVINMKTAKGNRHLHPGPCCCAGEVIQ